MSLYAALKGRGPSGFGYGSTAEEVTAGVDLTGTTFLLTGCNSGIGRETLRVLGQRGAHVIAAARSEEKARAALAATGAAGTAVACELSEPASVRAAADAVLRLGRPLDGIIANAGIMALRKLEQKLGYELQFLTNHLGHFLLVTRLLDVLAPAARVVILSSDAHRMAPAEGIRFDDLGFSRGYRKWRAYGQAKLANLLFARSLARRFAGTARTANAIHPGVIRTNLGRHMNPVLRGLMAVGGPLTLKTVPQGAATQCYVAANPNAAAISGEYWADCNPATPSARGRDDDLAERLWEVSATIIAKLP